MNDFKSTDETENVSDVEDEEINVSKDQKSTVSLHELLKVCRWEDGGKCPVQPWTIKESGFALKLKSKWLHLELSGFS